MIKFIIHIEKLIILLSSKININITKINLRKKPQKQHLMNYSYYIIHSINICINCTA